MTYRVVPFVASLSNLEGSEAAAGQLEKLINSMSEEGWEYIRLEKVETHVAGSAGCFGIGATAPSVTSLSMAVFRR